LALASPQKHVRLLLNDITEPQVKAIYNIDRPDMLSYSPYVSYPSEERTYSENYSRAGSESGRSTPSLSTYSDGKSPSSATTYMAAPRHFHIP
ncbi:hypothetical protein CRUP_023545, partial [Coryphaenoides rupestris]